MYKLKLLIGIILLTIVSCSENETESPIENPTTASKHLIKTIEDTDTGGQLTVFTYDGYKITQAVRGYYKIVYTYSGDLITQEDSFVNDELYYRNEYTYENNKLKTAVFKTTNSNSFTTPINDSKLVFTYLSEDILQIDIYSATGPQLLDWEPSQTFNKKIITFSNGNIVKREKYKTTDGTLAETISYEYDNSPNIYKNITGFDKLFFTISFTNNFNRLLDIHDLNNVNNVIYNSDTPARYSYVYDADGYPIEQRRYDNYSSYIPEKKYTYY